MQFTSANAQAILDGKKTQTRRPCVLYDGFNMGDSDEVTPDGIVYGNLRKKWQIGQVYAIQPGRGKKGVGCLKITAIRREKLHAITDADAIAEGFAGRDEFRAIWELLYPTGEYSWQNNPDVWVISFELVKFKQLELWG